MQISLNTGLAGKAVKILFVLSGLYVFFKYLLPWTLPFILAFLTASLLEPVLQRFIGRFHVSRPFASAAFSLTFLVVVITLMTLLVTRVIYEASSLAHHVPAIISRLASAVSSVKESIYAKADALPEGVGDFIKDAVFSVSAKTARLSERLTEFLLGFLSSAASVMPGIFLGVLTYVIGVFFISAGYAEIKSFILRQIPLRLRTRLGRVKEDMRSTLLHYLKAELILMGITFGELTFGFAVLKIPYTFMLSLAVSLIDALPVFGVGTVLLPWAASELILGDLNCAVSLAALYGVVTVVRSFIEPRIMGKQLGLHPVVTLLSMYVGFRSVGVTGMVFFPMIMILLKQFNDKGYLKLWKT